MIKITTPFGEYKIKIKDADEKEAVKQYLAGHKVYLSIKFDKEIIHLTKHLDNLFVR